MPSVTTRVELILGPQEEIAREYQAFIQNITFSQKLDGALHEHCLHPGRTCGTGVA